MSTFNIIVVLMILLVIALNIVSKRPKSLDELFVKPYISKKPLTQTEIDFYHQLRKALPEYIVLAQVQLASFIKVDRSLINPNESYKWQNPIAQQSVDYLICNLDFSIIAAVELDDKSHNSPNAIKRDSKKSANLEAANVPLIRWHAERMPSQDEVQLELAKYQYDKPKINSSDDNWIIEPNPQFLETKKASKNTLLIKLVLLIIGALLLLIGVNHYSNNISKVLTFPTNISKSITDNIKQRSQENLQGSIEKQKARKQEEITKRKAALALQKDFNEKQDQLRAEARREEMVKEDLWDRDYKSKLNCTDNDYAVDCGNAHINARKLFEAYWLKNKYKHLN